MVKLEGKVKNPEEYISSYIADRKESKIQLREYADRDFEEIYSVFKKLLNAVGYI